MQVVAQRGQMLGLHAVDPVDEFFLLRRVFQLHAFQLGIAVQQGHHAVAVAALVGQRASGALVEAGMLQEAHGGAAIAVGLVFARLLDAVPDPEPGRRNADHRQPRPTDGPGEQGRSDTAHGAGTVQTGTGVVALLR